MTVVELRHVCKSMRKAEVLRDISLSVDRGAVVGLEGENGSGKTMVMRVVCGLVRASSGSVLIAGKELQYGSAYPTSLGALIERPSFLPWKSGAENLRLLASIRGALDNDGIEEAMRAVGLDPHHRKPFRTYSLGMKQRLGIAAAVMERPQVVVLDEPTNALDDVGVGMVKRVVRQERERGAGVLISCHDHGVLRELSDRIYRMSAGSITAIE